MKIFVGNLPRNIEENEVWQLFEAFGQVETVTIVKDRVSGEPRGFGFVEMPKDEEANAAIAGLNTKLVKGRNLNVNKAQPRPQGGDRFKRGGRGGGGGFNRGRRRF